MSGLDEILQRGGEADDVLRAAVSALAEERDVAWAGISFREADGLVLGPTAGTPDEQRRQRVPIEFQGDVVGELVVDGLVEPGRLASVVDALAPYVLLGWDTGGEAWEP
jgi:hypothetical protein